MMTPGKSFKVVYYFLSKTQELEALNNIVNVSKFLGGKFSKTTSKFKRTKKILMLHVHNDNPIQMHVPHVEMLHHSCEREQ